MHNSCKPARYYPKLYDGQDFQVGFVVLGGKDVNLPMVWWMSLFWFHYTISYLIDWSLFFGKPYLELCSCNNNFSSDNIHSLIIVSSHWFHEEDSILKFVWIGFAMNTALIQNLELEFWTKAMKWPRDSRKVTLDVVCSSEFFDRFRYNSRREKI